MGEVALRKFHEKEASEAERGKHDTFVLHTKNSSHLLTRKKKEKKDEKR